MLICILLPASSYEVSKLLNKEGIFNLAPSVRQGWQRFNVIFVVFPRLSSGRVKKMASADFPDIKMTRLSGSFCIIQTKRMLIFNELFDHGFPVANVDMDHIHA